MARWLKKGGIVLLASFSGTTMDGRRPIMDGFRRGAVLLCCGCALLPESCDPSLPFDLLPLTSRELDTGVGAPAGTASPPLPVLDCARLAAFSAFAFAFSSALVSFGASVEAAAGGLVVEGAAACAGFAGFEPCVEEPEGAPAESTSVPVVMIAVVAG